MTKITRALAAAAIVLLSVAAPSTAIRAAGAQTFGEHIRRFDVTITVGSDGTLQIRETIAYDFGSTPRHGIFRDIVEREAYDNEHDRTYTIDVGSVTADGNPVHVQTSSEGGYRHLKIGDPDRTVTGVHRYRLAYRVRGAPLSFADHDELNWDAIGNQWPVPIDRAVVSVVAPAPITRVACYSGAQGSTLPCGAATSAGARASFSQGALPSGAGVTIVVGLPAGTIQPAPHAVLEQRKTFANAFSVTPLTAGLASGMTLIGVGGVAWLATRRGRDRRYTGSAVDAAMGNTTGDDEAVPLLTRVTGPIEFVPPDGIRPGQVGTLADEQANLLDVTATIVDLAVRGWLTIAEIEPEKHSRHPDYELTATPGRGKGTPLTYEQQLLHELFDNRASVKLSDLKYKFRASLSTIQSEMYDDVVAQGWYRVRPDRTRTVWHVVGVVAAFAGLGLTLLVANTTSFGIVPLSLILAGFALLLAAGRMPARTAKGTAALSRVRGFRRLFDEGEEDTRARFAEQHDIFSKYLPYAIVFGCTRKWAKAFEGIAAEELAAGWYVGNQPFSALVLASAVDDFGTAATGTMYASMPSSSGSSGFSGGFSGGGGGGGGGGSW